MLGVFSYNREEWYTLQLGCMYQKITAVGLPTNACDKHFYHMVQETEMTTIALSEINFKTFMKFKENDADGKMAAVKNIIWLEDKITPENKKALEEVEFVVHLYKTVVLKGREQPEETAEQPDGAPSRIQEPTEDDCFLIAYGPGTINGEGEATTPLGVKITHKMMM